jgi:hypothetical protein
MHKALDLLLNEYYHVYMKIVIDYAPQTMSSCPEDVDPIDDYFQDTVRNTGEQVCYTTYTLLPLAERREGLSKII